MLELCNYERWPYNDDVNMKNKENPGYRILEEELEYINSRINYELNRERPQKYPVIHIEIIDVVKNISIIKIDEWIHKKERGVYILTTKSGEIYVGSSWNILKRIKNHSIKDIELIDVYLTNYHEIVEKWFIKKQKPELNLLPLQSR